MHARGRELMGEAAYDWSQTYLWGTGGFSKKFNECGENTKDELIKRYGD